MRNGSEFNSIIVFKFNAKDLDETEPPAAGVSEPPILHPWHLQRIVIHGMADMVPTLIPAGFWE